MVQRIRVADLTRKVTYGFLIFVLAYIAYHLLTLKLFPLPWFDETYFCSVAESLMDHGDFIPRVAFHAKAGKEALTYGPVYFVLTGLSIKSFGLGTFQFRIVECFFGLLCFLVFFRMNTFFKIPRIYILPITALFMLDPFFNLGMHSGRMDLVALFFSLMSIWYYLRSRVNDIRQNIGLLASSSFALLAMLTTPRVIAILTPLLVIFIIDAVQKKWKSWPVQFGCWALPFIVLYSIWVFIAFGGYSEYFNYYTKVILGNKTAIHGFIGPTSYIPRHEWLLIATVSLILTYKLITDRAWFKNIVILFSISSILTFYLVILDWGEYSVLILPFYYLILLQFSKEFTFSIKNFRVYPLVILGIFNAGYITIKIIESFGAANQRSQTQITKFMEKHLPEGSKVVGPPVYYYAVRKSGSEYQFYNKYNTPEERERLLREDYGYQYLLIHKKSWETENYLPKLFMSNAELEKVADYHWKKPWFVLSPSERFGYDGTLYKRKAP